MSTTPMTPQPMPPRPAEPSDPELRERYRRDAEVARARRRVAEGERAVEVEPVRTPSGPFKVIAALVAVVLVVGAGLSMLGPMLQHDETSEQALPAGLTSLEVHSDTGQVRVRAAGPGEAPGVTRTVRSGLLAPDVSIETSAGRATLTSDCPGLASVCRVDWTVVVPEEAAARIGQGVGEVSVEGLAGDVDVRSGVGSVTVSDVAAESVAVELGVGDADITVAEPPRRVTARVGVGDLTVRVPADVPYRVHATGQNVANRLGSDPDAPRSIAAETGVGGLTISPS